MKKYLLLYIFALLAADLSAQCERRWSTELSRQGDTEIFSISPAGDGYQIFGTFIDSIALDSVAFVSNGGRDVFLAIADSSGKLQKTVYFGGGGDEIPAMVMASDSTLTIGGLTTCRDGKQTGSMFVRTYDNELKEKLDIDIPYIGKVKLDIVNITSDTILIGGSLKGTIKSGSLCINSQDTEHAFVIRYSSDGEYIDSWCSAGTGKHRLHSIDVDGESIALLLSAADGTFVTDTLPVTSFGRVVLMLSLDGDLSPQWVSFAKCSGYVEPSKISHTSSGTLASMNFSGELKTADSTFYSTGSLSSLVLCYDIDGSVLWANELDGGYCRIIDMACSDSLSVCTGYFLDVLTMNGDTICQSSTRQAFLLCFDKNGRLIWNTDVDSDGNNTGRSVLFDGDEIVLCSSSRKTSSRNSNGITSLSDIITGTNISKFKLKTDNDLLEDESSDDGEHWLDEAHKSLKNDDNGFMSINMFPNPTRHKAYWCTDGIKVSALEIYDVKGLLVIRKNLDGQTSGEIDMSRLANGTYVFRFISENETHTLEIIKR
ncbi:MAG: T9SS type A sorting domain-containing protein [Bacteroidales bacterium]|nr:T9SS type A sorting domain-containing protein [Bacteroidales bacterium]